MQAKYLWTLVAVLSIWLVVLFTSLFAPDLVYGSDQEHLKLAAWLNWLWGTIATVGVLRMLRHEGAQLAEKGSWMALGLGVAAIWLTVLLVSLLVPDVKTDSGLTRIPVAAIIAPIVATIFTRYLAEFLFEGLPGQQEEERI